LIGYLRENEIHQYEKMEWENKKERVEEEEREIDTQQ